MKPSSEQAMTRSHRFLIALFVFSCLLAQSGVLNASSEQRFDDMFLIYCATDTATFEGEILVSLKFLQTKQVQVELGLTDSQINNLNEAIESSNKALLEPYVKKGNHRDSLENIQKSVDATRKKLAEVLRSNQLSRFKGLMVQKYGPWNLGNKDFREVLRLTPEQKFKMDNVRAQMFNKINAMSDKPLTASSSGICKYVPIDNEAARDTVKKSEQSFLDLLSAGQRETLDKIKGKPVKMPAK
ncbi:MAG: hypothetical protein JJE30_15310 [Desulfuromonadales bacterium]|nr:hypothetical protein [Desulfuromonadales bacterium]